MGCVNGSAEVIVGSKVIFYGTKYENGDFDERCSKLLLIDFRIYVGSTSLERL